MKLREGLVQSILGAGADLRVGNRDERTSECDDVRIDSANSSSAGETRPRRAAAADHDGRRVDAVDQHAVAADGGAAEVERGRAFSAVDAGRRCSPRTRPSAAASAFSALGAMRGSMSARPRAPPTHPAASSASSASLARANRARGRDKRGQHRRRHRERRRVAEHPGSDRQGSRRDGSGAEYQRRHKQGTPAEHPYHRQDQQRARRARRQAPPQSRHRARSSRSDRAGTAGEGRRPGGNAFGRRDQRSSSRRRETPRTHRRRRRRRRRWETPARARTLTAEFAASAGRTAKIRKGVAAQASAAPIG